MSKKKIEPEKVQIVQKIPDSKPKIDHLKMLLDKANNCETIKSNPAMAQVFTGVC